MIRAPTAEFQGAAGGSLNIVMRGASPKKETYMWFTDQYVWGKHGPSLFVSQTGPLGPPPPKPAAAGIPESSWSYFMSFNLGERNLGSDTGRQTSVNTAAPTTASIDDQSRLRSAYWIPRRASPDGWAPATASPSAAFFREPIWMAACSPT